MKRKSIYKVIKQFDAYYCCFGRITVNPGAEFVFKDDRIYFINTKNFLPRIAQKDFITSHDYEEFDLENYINEIDKAIKFAESKSNFQNEDSPLYEIMIKCMKNTKREMEAINE